MLAVTVDFDARPDCKIEVEIKVDKELKESLTFSQDAEINWEQGLYVA